MSKSCNQSDISSLDCSKKVLPEVVLLNKDIIHSIVDSLEISLSVERTVALTHQRTINDDLINAVNIMRSFENSMIGAGSNYAEISIRL